MATLASLTVDIATNTAKFASGMDRVDRRFRRFERSARNVRRLAAGVFAAVATSGVSRYVSNTLEAIDATNDYADALGVSSQKLQALQYAAQRVQLPADKLNDILKDTAEKIGDAYATGGGEAVDALDALGISAERLVNLSPDEQLLAIADQLDNVGTRAEKIQILESLASDASLLLPLLEDDAAGLRELTDEAVRTGYAMEDELADKASKANEQIRTMKQQISSELATRIAQSADNITALASAIADVTGRVIDFVAEAPGFARWIGEIAAATAQGQELSGFGAGYDTLQRQIKETTQELEQYQQQYDRLMERFQGMPDALEASTKIDNPSMNIRSLGENIVESQAKLRGLKAELESYFDTQAPTDRPDTGSGLPDRPLPAIGGGDDGGSPSRGGGSVGASKQDLFDFNAAMNDGIRDQARIADLYDRNQEELSRLLGKYDEGAARLNTYNEAQDELNRLFEAGMISQDQFTDALGEVMNDFDGLDRVSRETGDKMNDFWQEAADNMQRTMSGLFFDVMQGEFSDMAGSFKKTIDQMVADLLASQLLDYVKGAWGSTSKGGGLMDTIGGFASNIFGGMFGGGRAIGGPVSGGTPYMVGEHGPEMFVPPGAGSIVPNSQMGGGDINITNHYHGVRDARGIEQAGNRQAADAARALQRARRDM